MAKKQELQDKRFELYERAHTKEYYAVAKWLSEVKFSPAVFGVDQADVWRKLEKLCELYEAALEAERARNAKLERKLRSVTGGNRPDPQVKQEIAKPVSVPAENVKKEDTPAQPKPQTAQNHADAPTKEEPVRKEKADAPKGTVSSQEELILQDLLREFGPKGGEPNG